MTFTSNLEAQTIDEVIARLGEIIDECVERKSRLAFFPVLYRKVTIAVKEAIENKEFENNERMEKLDIIFANRYLKAYAQFTGGENPTDSWLTAFAADESFWPIVLQHLILGMNAHINLDLGIAAAQVAPGEQIDSLENDFNKINEILSSLSEGVKKDITEISPLIRFWDSIASKFDEAVANFSIELARAGAWKFAKDLAKLPQESWEQPIHKRDEEIARFGRLLWHPGIILSIILGVMRLTEWASIKRIVSILTT